jgi:23S rRNA (uracil1939-C5)-methyltransferase
MSRNKVKNIEELEIEKVASEGKCLGKKDGKVVFVPFTAPGDVVDVFLTKSRKSFGEGRVTKYHKKSDLRIEPFCSHFTICGGCKWQHLPYDKQLEFKQEHVLENLNHLGALNISDIQPIIGSEKQTFYRNKLDYTFTNRRWLTEEELASNENFEQRAGVGFHIPGRFDAVLNLDKCYLQSEFSNNIRDHIKEYAYANTLTFYNVHEHNGLLRNLVIRNTSDNQQMVLVQFGEDDIDAITPLMQSIASAFPFITSLQYIINLKNNETYFDQEIVCFHGQDHIVEPFTRWDGSKINFKISPKSFFQTNNSQAEVLYKETFDLAKLTGEEVVYDLYTGTGTIANYIANKAKKVVGIEYIEDAIADARVNAELNNIKNTVFYAGDMKKVLNEAFIAKNGQPDVIITDPPRAGMDVEVVEVILKAKPKRIVYVSCNPATQARDLKALCEDYTIETVQPVDMFPHTHHCENIVSLVRK